MVLTAAAILFGWDVRTVSDMGALPDTLPVFLWVSDGARRVPRGTATVARRAHAVGRVVTDFWA